MYRTLLAIIAAVSTVAFAQFASAADLPVKAPLHIPIPLNDQTAPTAEQRHIYLE
jgi:hypothetical protein